MLDATKRSQYLAEYQSAVIEIVEYIKDNDEQPSSFEEIANIQGVDVETVKEVFEKHKNSVTSRNVNLNEVQQLAFQINKVQNAYNAVLTKLDDITKSKFLEQGINLASLSDALKIQSCSSSSDIEAMAFFISKISYELYNKQIFSSKIKNALMDIFDPKSTKGDSLVSFVHDKNLDVYFKQNDWVLFRYIRSTCTLMKKSEPVDVQKIANIPSRDRKKFIGAMKCVFHVTIGGGSDSLNQKGIEEHIIPDEVMQGETELKLGRFERAKILFRQALSKDPYCWQAYWGMFKSCIQARTDNEVYFPGFLDLLKKSEQTNDHPDFIDYYKNAKFNAAAQRATEINFGAIEIEYKKADKADEAIREQFASLKSIYESVDLESIPSPKGKECAAKTKKTAEHLVKILAIKTSSIWTKILLIALGGSFIFFSIDTSGIDFFRYSPRNVEILCMILAFLPSIIVGVFVGLLTSSFLIGCVGFAIPLGIMIFLSNLSSNVFIIRVIVCVVFAVGGGFTMLLGINKMLAHLHSVKKAETVEAELKKNLQELMECFIADMDRIYKQPLAVRYRVSSPDDFNLEFNEFWKTVNEQNG